MSLTRPVRIPRRRCLTPPCRRRCGALQDEHPSGLLTPSKGAIGFREAVSPASSDHAAVFDELGELGPGAAWPISATGIGLRFPVMTCSMACFVVLVELLS